MIFDTLVNDFVESIFTEESMESILDAKEGSVLKLRLERTAREQIGYAKWLYGGRIKKQMQVVRELAFEEGAKDYIQFNFKKNSFTFVQPAEWLTDDFYYLFDYLKEVYLENGYRVTDAIKETKIADSCFKNTETYILIDSVTHHLVKLEVVSINDQPNKIVGWGYPTDDNSSKVNHPHFFSLVKDVFEKQY